MKPKHILVFVALAFIFFLAYVFKGTFIGTDSYFFLNIIFGELPNIEAGFFGWFIPLVIPQNIILIKAILVFMLMLNMILIAKAGQIVFGNKGWLCGLFLLVNGVFLFESLKFEEEQFVYLVLFFAFLLFVYAVYNKKYLELIGVGIILFVCFDAWITKFNGIPFMASLDYIPFSTVLPMSFALAGLIGYFWDKRLKPLFFPAMLVVLVSIILPKVSVFAAPFLALGLFPVFERLEKKVGVTPIRVIVICFVFAFASFLFFGVQPTTLDDQRAVDFAVQSSKDFNLPINNDWEFGYLVAWRGGQPSSWGGGVWNTDFNESITLTKLDVGNNCELLKSFVGKSVFYCN